MGVLKPQEFRYEQKFLIDQLNEHQVKSILKLHHSIFFEIYPPRYVNNIYLDSVSLGSYFDNLAGTTDRMKVRIRWYGELLGNIKKPMLEFKIKQGNLCRKVRYSIKSFVVDEHFSNRYFKDIIRGSTLPQDVNACLVGLNIALLNRYYRYYFETIDRKFRVTIDMNMAFYKVSKLQNNFIVKQLDRNHIVVELKYEHGYDELVDSITAAFPFRVTKNSKYVQGIERIWM